jgi:hypothetical protein
LGGVIAVHDRVLTIKLQTGARLAFLFLCSRTDVILVALHSALTAIRDCTPPTVDVAHCIIGAFLAALVGQPKPYNELAWFWSDQGDLKLMIAGLAHGVDQSTLRGDPATGILNLRLPRRQARHGGIGRPRRLPRRAKRVIGTTKTLTPEEAADPAFDLRGLAKR